MKSFQVKTKEDFEKFIALPNVQVLETPELVASTLLENEVVFYNMEDGYAALRIVDGVLELMMTQYGSDGPEVMQNPSPANKELILRLVFVLQEMGNVTFYWEPGLTIED